MRGNLLMALLIFLYSVWVQAGCLDLFSFNKSFKHKGKEYNYQLNVSVERYSEDGEETQLKYDLIGNGDEEVKFFDFGDEESSLFTIKSFRFLNTYSGGSENPNWFGLSFYSNSAKDNGFKFFNFKVIKDSDGCYQAVSEFDSSYHILEKLRVDTSTKKVRIYGEVPIILNLTPAEEGR